MLKIIKKSLKRFDGEKKPVCSLTFIFAINFLCGISSNMIRKLLLLSSFICFFLLNSCKHNPDAKENNDFAIFQEVRNLKKTADYGENESVQKLDLAFENLLFRIRNIEDRAYVSVKNNDDVIIDWKPFLINFTYDTTKENAENDIHLLINGTDKSKGYLMFPSYTEQFSSYFVYYFSVDQLNLIGDYSKNTFETGSFSYNETEQKLFFVSGKKHFLEKTESDYSEFRTIISSDLELLRSEDDLNRNQGTETSAVATPNSSDSNVYFTKILDINGDRINDKIISHKRYQGDD